MAWPGLGSKPPWRGTLLERLWERRAAMSAWLQALAPANSAMKPLSTNSCGEHSMLLYVCMCVCMYVCIYIYVWPLNSNLQKQQRQHGTRHSVFMFAKARVKYNSDSAMHDNST